VSDTFFEFNAPHDDPFARAEDLARGLNELHDQMLKVEVLPKLDNPIAGEDTTVITVRIPKSLHKQLKDKSHSMRTSMNKLCVAKLASTAEVSVEPTDTASVP
jgi:hypothetical protein